MKLRQIIVAAFLMTMAVWRSDAQTGSTNASAWESWETISNRWTAVPTDETTKAAEKGDLSAQYYLGVAYEQGYGVSKDADTAYKWIRPLAEKGMPAAQRKVGWMLEKGLGVAVNRDEAMEWDRKAAEQGDMLGQINLGSLYAHGDLKSRNYEQAEKWTRKAAETGNPRGQYALGYLLINEFNEQGTQIANFPEAAEWLQKSADQGYAHAQLELANLYYYGKLGDDKRSNSIPWFLKAAAQGEVKAKAMLGKLQTQYPDSELLKKVDSVGSLRDSAATGNLDAQLQLADRYQNGDGVPVDLAQAFSWMQKAAAHDGSQSTKASDAQYRLGVMYEKGEGTSPDPAMAARYYQQAANGQFVGKPDAVFHLGRMYENGTGVAQDDRKAAECYFAGSQFGPSYADTVRVFSKNGGDAKQSHLEVINNNTGTLALESLLNLYSQGRGLPEDSSAVAQQLAQLQNAPGQTARELYLLGEIDYQGKLAPKNVARAVERFNKAANQGLPEAMNRLGDLWAAGLDGAPDLKEAASWYRKAAKKGFAKGELNLGRAYQKGEGVEQNPVEAWAWMHLAADQKLPGAHDEASMIEAKFSSEQHEAATQLAAKLTAEISALSVK